MRTDDDVELFFEDRGAGPPILFAHEFGGDWRTWDALVGKLCGAHRCIRFSARGFRPSGVPAEPCAYGQARQVQDLLAVADGLALDRFHLVGLSMGSFTSLMFALDHTERLASLTLMGCSGGPRDDAARTTYQQALQDEIALLESHGGDGAVRWFSEDPAYARMASKAPAAWARYLANLKRQSVPGALNTLRSVHWHRVSLCDLTARLETMIVPTLLIHGDEDHPLIAPTNAFLQETLPRCRRVILPETGHLVHHEEQAAVLAALRHHLATG